MEAVSLEYDTKNLNDIVRKNDLLVYYKNKINKEYERI